MYQCSKLSLHPHRFSFDGLLTFVLHFQIDGWHPFIFRRYPGTVSLVSFAAQAAREPHPLSLAVARAMDGYFRTRLLKLPTVIDQRRGNQEWDDMVTAITMRGRPPLPHWMMPPPPQQTIKEAYFDPIPNCDPEPSASFSADRVLPFEE